MSEHDDLFGSFNRPSFETADMLIARLGESGLADLRSSLTMQLEHAETEATAARRVLDEKMEAVKELRADHIAVLEAIAQARDRGLE